MYRCVLLVMIFVVWVGAVRAGAQVVVAEAAATPTDKNVLIVSIDGARPDLLLRANAPVFRSMLARGSYTMWARTTAMAVTLPSHTSMVTGVEPRKHGIEWNSDLKFAEPVYPRYPTIFELAKKVGYSTALVTGKTKFSFLNKPGTIDHVSVNEGPLVSDRVVAETAAALIAEKQLRVMLVHFAKVDTVGHAKGWGTDEHIAAIEEADAALGVLITAIEKAGKTDSTYVILSADHGGAGLTHGPEDARSRHIPWVIVGPGVRKNYDMARVEALQVETTDTFATACELLKIPVVRRVDGKFVAAAMERLELIGDKK